jgi:V/A-type H+-transporting ATPase subunit B
VNGKTRSDHRTIMDTMIQLFADYRETQEKQAMGFQMNAWDIKLLAYGKLFEDRMMSLKVNIPLEKALDLGWEMLHACFSPEETGIKKSMIDQYWPEQV